MQTAIDLGDAGEDNDYGHGFLDAYAAVVAVLYDPTAVDDSPAPLSQLLTVPNPFNPRTSLRFTTAAAGRVRVAIYDLRGHLVTTVIDGILPAGRHEVAWDGQDSSGGDVPGGVYLSRLETGEQVVHGRMLLIR
jgi:hypothetical protein